MDCQNHFIEHWATTIHEKGLVVGVNYYYGCKTCGLMVKKSEKRIYDGG